MSVRYTVAAEDDLIVMYLDGLAKFGVTQAEVYAATLSDALERLSLMPSIGRKVSEFGHGARVYQFQSHLAIYDL